MMKLRHITALALVGWYLMMPPSVREDSWFCSGGLLAMVSHDLFGTESLSQDIFELAVFREAHNGPTMRIDRENSSLGDQHIATLRWQL
jgi:hypothetical protein